MGIREVIVPEHSWVIGNGRDIKFWTDKWLSDYSLDRVVIAELPEGYGNITAREMWLEGGGWNLTRIAPFITEETRLELPAVVVDVVTGAKDCLSWGQTPSGKFTVKSAYKLLTRDEYPGPNNRIFFVSRIVTTIRKWH